MKKEDMVICLLMLEFLYLSTSICNCLERQTDRIVQHLESASGQLAEIKNHTWNSATDSSESWLDIMRIRNSVWKLAPTQESDRYFKEEQERRHQHPFLPR